MLQSPQLGGVVAEYVIKNGQDVILRLTTAKSEDSTVLIEKLRSSTAISVAPQEAWQTPAKSLFYKLSATHLIYLSNFDNDLKRAFYEQEAIRGCWTVTELDRQVSSQYYERMGLSKDKKALQKLAVKNAQQGRAGVRNCALPCASSLDKVNTATQNCGL